MIKLTKLVRQNGIRNKPKIQATLSLPIETRIKSRSKVTLDNGDEAGFVIARGYVIRNGDYLTNDENIFIQVLAAEEAVSSVYSEDSFQLMRAAYHLGNRHVPLQVGKNFLRYQHDHVLDDMINGLGLQVTVERASFEPEAGAYHGETTDAYHPHIHSHHYNH